MNDTFIADVMRRTAGSPCETARARMVERADEPLLAGHLEHCANCRAFESALTILDAELPTMAAVDPGPAFTAAVLDRTVDAPAPLPLVARVDRAFAKLFGVLAQRPRLGLELGYVGAMVLWILFGLPDVGKVQRFAEASTAWTTEGSSLRLTMPLDTERREIVRTSQELGSAARELDVVRGSQLVGELATRVVRLPAQLFTDEEPQIEATEPNQAPSASPNKRQAC